MSTITLDTSLARPLNESSEIERANAQDALLGDPAQAETFARLRGIYVNQVHARVDRTWERPAELILTSNDQCTALVLQDPNGIVLEIELADCPDDIALRQSVVKAIYRASPLPAPPDRSVFTERLRIDFDLKQNE